MAHDKVYGFCEAKCKVEVVEKATNDERMSEIEACLPKDGTKGQVWTSDGAGAGSWQTPMKFKMCDSLVYRYTEKEFTTSASYDVGSLSSEGNSFVMNEDLFIGFTRYSVTKSTTSTLYSVSLTKNDLSAIVTSILGISDFSDFPDCTLSFNCYYGGNESLFCTGTIVIKAVISGGTATFSYTGYPMGAWHYVYLAVKNITMS